MHILEFCQRAASRQSCLDSHKQLLASERTCPLCSALLFILARLLRARGTRIGASERGGCRQAINFLSDSTHESGTREWN